MHFFIAKLLSPAGLSALAALASVFVPEVGVQAQEAAKMVGAVVPATSSEAGAYAGMAAMAAGWFLSSRKARKDAASQP